MPQPWLDISELENPSDPYAEFAIDAATFVLWSLSGRKYSGVRTVTEQYVCPEFDLPLGCSWEDGSSFKNVAGYTGYVVPEYIKPSAQGYGLRFRLRNQPVRKIVSVQVGDVILPSASHTYLRNHSQLVITDSRCSTLCDGPTVTYMYGVAPPSIGRLAATELANEYVKFFNNEECALPKNVSSISKQGMTIEVYDPADFLDNGRVGLPLADIFIATANPGKSKKPAKVFSVDKPRGFTRK